MRIGSLRAMTLPLAAGIERVWALAREARARVVRKCMLRRVGWVLLVCGLEFLVAGMGMGIGCEDMRWE